MATPPAAHIRSSAPGLTVGPRRRHGRALRALAGAASVAVFASSLVLSITSAAASTPPLASDAPVQHAYMPNGQVHAVASGGGYTYLAGNFGYIGQPTGSGVILGKAGEHGDARFPEVTGQIDAVAADGSGGWFIGGQFTSVGGQERQRLAHVLADGSLDPEWNPGADGPVRALVVLGNGLYVGGVFTSIGGESRRRLARVSIAGAGEVDPQWNPTVQSDQWTGVNALVLAGSDLFVGGSFNAVGGQARNSLAKLSTSGTGPVDSDWNPNVSGSVNALAVAGTKLYVGGYFAYIAAEARSNLASLSTVGGGALDGWSPNPQNGAVRALAASDTELYVGGDFDRLNFIGGFRKLVKFSLPTGQLDTSWKPLTGTFVTALALSGTHLYVGGNFNFIGDEVRAGLARLSTSGTGLADRTWNHGTDGVVYALAESGPDVFVGGQFISGGGPNLSGLARLSSDGVPDPVWNPGIGGARALLLAGSHLYVGGGFTSPRTRLARVSTSGVGALDTTWSPSPPNGTVNTLALSGTDLYIGGAFTGILTGIRGATTTRNRLAKLSTVTSGSGGLDPTWNPNASGDVNTMLLSGPALYVGGAFGTFASPTGQVSTRNRLAKLSTAGTGAPDPTWNPNANGTVHALALSDTDLYVGGAFTAFTSSSSAVSTRNFLAKVSASGTGALDPSWNPNPNSEVTAVALSGADLYAGGYFTTLTAPEAAPVMRNRLAKLSASGTGTTDLTWNPNANGTVHALALSDTDLYVGGAFTQVGGSNRRGIAHFILSAMPVLAFGTTEPAQPRARAPFTLQTSLLNGTGTPIEGAAVTLATAEGVTGLSGTLTAVTSADGLARFADLAFDKPGTYTVTASAAGSASVTTTVTVDKAVQTLTFAQPDDTTYGTPTGDAPTVTSSAGLPVALTSNTPLVCTVDGSSLVLEAAGSCSLTATQEGDEVYEASSLTRTFAVGKAIQSIAFGELPDRSLSDSGFDLAGTASSGLAVEYSVTPGSTACSVTGSRINLHAEGTCSVIAAQPGDENHEAAEPVVQTFTLAKATQDITFDTLPDLTFGDAAPTLAATATSGAAVEYRVATPDSCSVNGSTLTVLGAGSCSVTASQPGTDRYNAAAPLTRAFTIAKATQTLSLDAPADKTFGDDPFPVAGTASSDLPVIVTAAPGGPCSVQDGTITLTGAGTCVLSATQVGTVNYESVTLTRTLTIAKAPQNITFTAPTDQLMTAVSLTPGAAASSGLPVLYTVDAGSCTVEGDSVVLDSAGTCTVTASQAGSGDWLPAASVTHSFTVSKAPQSIDVVEPPAATFGDPALLLSNYLTASSGEALDLEVLTSTTCSLTSDGSLVLLHAGTCTVQAGQKGTQTYLAAEPVTWSLTIDKASQSIDLEVPVNATYRSAPFAVTATASSGLDVIVAAAEGSNCTVSGLTITLTGAGFCKLTASQPGDDDHLPASADTKTITVEKAEQAIAFGAVTDRTAVDPSFELEASTTYGLPVTFTVPAGSACQLTGSTLTPDGSGTCTVTASQGGDADHLPAAAVTRTFSVSKADQSISFDALPGATFGDSQRTLAASASSGGDVTFAVGADDSCSISGTTLQLTGAGTCHVTATQAGDRNYNAAPPITRTFTIGKAQQSIELTAPASKTYGDEPFTVTATASSGLPVSLSVETDGGCTASPGTGQVTITVIGAGACIVVASQSGGSNHLAAGDSRRTISVAKAAQNITFAALTDRTLGAANETLTASTDSGLAVTWSATGSACTVTGLGRLHLVAAGTCDITAAQTGDANHSAATPVTRTLTVLPPPPTIIWTPSATYYALDSAPTCTASQADGTGVVCTVTGFDSSSTGGPRTMTASATAQGSTATATAEYSIARWSTGVGFKSPVTMDPTKTNRVKGGSTVPLKFTVHAGLKEQTGSGTVAAVLLMSVSCDKTDEPVAIHLESTSVTGVRYDAVDRQWIYNWKAPTATGCYRVGVKLNDGHALLVNILVAR